MLQPDTSSAFVLQAALRSELSISASPQSRASSRPNCHLAGGFAKFSTAMALHEQLKKILVCPVCHTSLRSIGDDEALECTSCGRRYPVRDGIPVMLPEEATPPTNASSPKA
jgi:uncharacterized protein